MPTGFSWAAPDGTVAGNLATPGVLLPKSPLGMAIDAAAGRVYFVTSGEKKLRFAKLDGSGGGEIPMPGVTFGSTHGVAVDPVAGRAYIADTTTSKIHVVKLDGSGGSDLVTTGAPLTEPWSIAVDPAGGRVYWGNSGGMGGDGSIGFANLDGSGGGSLNLTGAKKLSTAYGLAVDPAAGRLYYANGNVDKISFARLDGGGAADVNTTGATVDSPRGLAVDAQAGRLYIANGDGKKISFARLDNTGGADLSTLSATVGMPWGVAVLKAPANTAPPTATVSGSTLTCADGTWAPDIPGAFFAQAPQTLTYAWSRDNQPVAGATTKTLQAPGAGSYTCTVTATNQAGSTPLASAPVAIGGPMTPATPPPSNPGQTPTQPSTAPKASVKITQIKNGALSVTTSARGTLTITAGDKTKKITKTLNAGSYKLKFALTTSAKKTLVRNHRLSIIFTAKLAPAGGGKAVIVQKSTVVNR
jgi:DNA-binding beta-propeller fold protein YncE